VPYGDYNDPELLEEARSVIRSAQDPHHVKRAQAILFPVEFGITLAQFAQTAQLSTDTVARLRREFLAIFQGEEDRRKFWGGERKRNLLIEEEEALLATFEKKAEAGQILTITPIQAAYEKKVGHKVKNSVVYRMLERHGWRKVVPRHKHKKSSNEVQDEWKKKPCWMFGFPKP
jgi:transposase